MAAAVPLAGTNDEMLRACSLTREEKMQMVRRRFLHFAGAATALFASPCLVRAQEQAPKIGLPPPRHLHQVQADASSPIRPLILIPAQRVSSHLS